MTTYEKIISLDNLLAAWQGFFSGKRSRLDVQEFGRDLMSNLVTLHGGLSSLTYEHSNYTAFNISDPKPRRIHKAIVRDRVLHHAIYRQLYPFFDRTFIADSFSCRLDKGVHKGFNRFRQFAYKASQNYTKTAWVLKCDISKFFASIDHAVLLNILSKYIPDLSLMILLQEIIDSFELQPGQGLPLGNLTSQLFCNVYMNQLDQFVKHRLRAKYYIRYADDFILLSQNKVELEHQLKLIDQFLSTKLHLRLHPQKVSILSINSGVDFLGWKHFPTHRTIRTVTKRRMLRRVRENKGSQSLQSYLGLLQHGNAFKIKQHLLDIYESAETKYYP